MHSLNSTCFAQIALNFLDMFTNRNKMWAKVVGSGDGWARGGAAARGVEGSGACKGRRGGAGRVGLPGSDQQRSGSGSDEERTVHGRRQQDSRGFGDLDGKWRVDTDEWRERKVEAHTPVLLGEELEWLPKKTDGIYVDATLGARREFAA